ncbi:MAG: radical SAM protein [Proteobacteria bacterium]|nr:radical SAM protein [Pseudomonadota bacterium]MCP4915641.1 radical SAM protein [Pseudomonadota bacterium]
MTRDVVLAGMRRGTPATGPLQVHIDITNGCNAACVTCWDHSPLLTTPRSNDWKRRRMTLKGFRSILTQLDAMESVNAVVVSGMGDPLTHPHVYEMLGEVKARGWHLTVLSNLVAADIDRLIDVGVDNLLVGVQGATPDTHTAFHPGWNEQHFIRMCRYLRRLGRAGVNTRHVQVISRETADEVVEMVRFGRLFRAERVNFKLAALAEGTEECRVTPAQLAWLDEEGIPQARELAEKLEVHTNLDLFAAQVASARRSQEATTPIEDISCWMGFVYTRITVDREVLYCCNTNVQVGSLDDASFGELWWGERWQQLRERLAAGKYFKGCDRCGKFEQNTKWAARLG